MTKRKWIAASVAVLTMILAFGWYFASPAYTVSQMNAAASQRDAETFVAYIDFAAVRADMHEELKAIMLAEAEKGTPGFGPREMAYGMRTLGPFVDGAMSPSLVKLMIVTGGGRNYGLASKLGPMFVAGDGARIERKSLAEFRVEPKDRNGFAIIFRRQGLGWKLSGFDLPPDGGLGLTMN